MGLWNVRLKGVQFANQFGDFAGVQHRVVWIYAQFRIEGLLVLNPHGGDTAFVRAGYVRMQAVPHVNCLAGLTACQSDAQ